MINVGARSSSLFFKNIEGFFVRTINYGAILLTQFISDTLGKGFSEADEIKRRFFEEEDVDESSPAYKLMQSCITNFSSRFAQEVNDPLLCTADRKMRVQLNGFLLQEKEHNQSLFETKF